MRDDTRVRAMMATALVLALAAMLAGPAAARPIDVDGTELSSSQVPVARPDDRGGPLGVGAIAEPKPVIPYVSQGLGVDTSQFSGSQTADANSGWFTGLEHADLPAAATQPTLQSDDRTGWLEPTTFGVAMAGLLLAAMALLGVRRRPGGGIAA